MADEETFDYDPPVVTWDEITRRVEVEDEETGKVVVENEVTGHKVNPPYDDSWDEITKLRWFAALIGHRTGVQVRVAQKVTHHPSAEINEGHSWDEINYLVSTQHMESREAAPYNVTWSWLSGLEAGIYEGRISG
jgi:hypothetical protein